MAYEWDPVKARLNSRKHGIQYADAVTALEDEYGLSMPDPSSDEEQRWITLGRDALGRLLLVVYTWRGDQLRLISARRATSRESRQYERGL